MLFSGRCTCTEQHPTPLEPIHRQRICKRCSRVFVCSIFQSATGDAINVTSQGHIPPASFEIIISHPWLCGRRSRRTPPQPLARFLRRCSDDKPMRTLPIVSRHALLEYVSINTRIIRAYATCCPRPEARKCVNPSFPLHPPRGYRFLQFYCTSTVVQSTFQ